MAESPSAAPGPPEETPPSAPAHPPGPELRVVGPKDAPVQRPREQPRETFRIVPRPRVSWLGLTRGDQVLLASFAAVIGLLLAAHWALLSHWGQRPVEVEHLEGQSLDYQIDVNTADRLELMQLEGIGETLADRIVDDRETNGPFETIDDLQRVKGIGPKTVEKLRPFARAGDGE